MLLCSSVMVEHRFCDAVNLGESEFVFRHVL